MNEPCSNERVSAKDFGMALSFTETPVLKISGLVGMSSDGIRTLVRLGITSKILSLYVLQMAVISEACHMGGCVDGIRKRRY